MKHIKLALAFLGAISTLTLTSCGETYYKVRFLNDDGSLLFENDKVLADATPEYQGNTPLKAKTDQYTYTFKGWDKEVAPATSDIDYTATYEVVTNQYEVRFVNYDDTLITTINVPYDGTAEFPSTYKTPEKPTTDQYSYTFKGWDESLEHIKKDVTRKALFTETVRTYKVEYKNFDGTLLDTQSVEYGKNAHYDKATPTKASDSTYDYVFFDWDYSETNIVKDMVFTALFKKVLKQYTVTFYDGNDKVAYTAMVGAGTDAVYLGATPTKASDEKYDYTFKSWDKALTNILANTEFHPTFEAVLKTFYVSFKNDDGTLLKTESVKYGETVSYTGATPTKASTAKYSYFFSGWDKPLTNITNSCDRYAKFTSSVNSYTVKFVNYDGSALQSSKVDYGASIEYSGAKPTKPADDDYGYVFTGWDKSTDSITQNITVTAQFSKADYLDYVLSGDETYYIAYKSATATLPETIAIPSKYKNLPVKAIGGSAFKESSIKKVIISDSVTSIGNDAFSSCKYLSSVSIPSSVISVGNSAFWNCTSLSNISIPSSVTSIGNSAFKECTSLSSISIPSSVTSIGNSAFLGCTSLLSISIPSSVTSISDSAFWNCTSLSNISIPSSVTSIVDCAFSDCHSLSSISIPSSVTFIGWSAFSGCTVLFSVSYGGTKAAFTAAVGTNKLSNIFSSTRVQYVQCSDGKVTLS